MSSWYVGSCVDFEVAVPPLALAHYEMDCQLDVMARHAERLDLLGLPGDLHSIEDTSKSSSEIRRCSKIGYRVGIYQ